MQDKTIHELRIGESAERVNVVLLENAQRYADITGDNNLIHFDTGEARSSRYRRPIAHGMILAGYISGVIGAQLPGTGCVYETQTLSFLRPVFYGDEIKTRVTVTGIDVARNRVTLLTECFNQSRATVLTGEAVVLPRKE